MILRTTKALTAACCLLLFATTAIAQTAPPASASVPVPVPITPNGTVVEDVIARVNDQIITRSDVERAQAEFDQEAQGQNLNPADVADHQKNLLRDLIDQQLLLSKGKELDINPDAQVITQLDEIRKQNHLATMADLEKAAQDQGVSFEDFKANIRNSLITQQVVRDQVGAKLQLSHADVDKYYAAHKADFTQQESVKLSEILIATPAGADGSLPDDATVAAAKAKADDVAAKLKTGASFSDLAKQASNGPTAADGGDLGEFKRGALAPALEEKTFVLQAGGVTDPIRTRQGFVILKVTAHTLGGVQPLANVEDRVEEAVYMQQMQPALRAYLTQLREEAYIDIKPGFVDTGASPKQTKPVFTAYAPPEAKKKPQATEKKRFDRHGYVADTSAPAAAPAATPAVAAAPAKKTPFWKMKSSGKPQKAKREKVRFGQAPRETLPSVPGGQVTPLPTQVGTAQGTTSMMAEALPDPNAAPAAATEDQDPLGPHAGPKKKSRYAQHPEAPKKPKPKLAPIAAGSAPPTEEESATEKVQAAPLGLNGDTAKKKKKATKDKTKHKRAKQRLAEPAPAAPAKPIEPTTDIPVTPPPPSTTPPSS